MYTPAVTSSPFYVRDNDAVKEVHEEPVRASSRPRLTPPQDMRFSDLRLLTTSEETRNLGNAILDNLGLRLSFIKEQISETSAQNIQKLKEAAEKASASGFWDMLKKIATSLLSALSVIFGISLLASGGGVGLIGGAMLSSGILSLANFAFAETGVWDWVAKQLAHDNEDYQRKIATLLPIAVGVVSAGLGIAGSVWSLGTGAVQFAEKAMYVAQTGLAIFNAGTSFGKGNADAQLLWTQAELATIQGKLTTERSEYTSLIQGIKGSLSDFRTTKSLAKQTIQNISRSNIQLVR